MKNFKLRQIVTALLTFLLVSLGVQPFVEANSLSSPFWLFSYVGIIVITASFSFRWFIELFIYLSSLLMTCYLYFPLGLPPSWRWLKLFGVSTLRYIDTQHASEYSYLPENFALLLIGIFTIFIVKLMIDYENWFFPFLSLLVYLLILSVFNEVDLNKEVIAVVFVSLIAAYWFGSDGTFSALYKGTLFAVFPVLVMLIISWGIPRVFPVATQQLQLKTQPLRVSLTKEGFYKFFNTGRGNVSATGFGEDDRTLGGPVYADESVAFFVNQKRGRYLRVESKDEYTGKGWTSSEEGRMEVKTSPFEFESSESSQYKYDPTGGERISLVMIKEIAYIPYPIGKVKLVNLPSGVFQFDDFSSRLYVNHSGNSQLGTLTYEYIEPSYSLENLKEAKALYPLSEYTQLPEDLPKRVGELARSITKSDKLDYDKVKSVETYLKYIGDFRYSLEEARYVPQSEDYVDFFLFESQVGYCEHFSSSMVVLLRTLGIPARWVKGFSEGTVTGENDEVRTYKVTNANAHAWVEVYFERIGWVPFEPTKSFVSSEQLALSKKNTSKDDTPSIEQSREEQLKDTATSSEQERTESSNAPDGTKKTDGKDKETSEGLEYVMQIFLVVILGLLLLFGIKKRHTLRWGLFLLALEIFPRKDYSKYYLWMLKLLQPIRDRDLHVSLREYVGNLRDVTAKWDMSLIYLTEKYEKIVYGSNHDIGWQSQDTQAFKKVARIAMNQVSLFKKK